MLTSSLVFIVFILLILLIKEKLDGATALPVDGLQLAHDLRSPLLVLKSLLKDGEGFDGEKREMIKKLLNRMEEMTSLKKQTNSEHFKKDELTSLDIKSILNEIIAEKKIEFGGKNISWVLDIQTSNSTALAKDYPLKRIFSNILNNSVEAMSEKLKLELCLKSTKENELIIELTDNGKGLSQSQIEKVFERGYSTKEMGQGLGLYHARKEISKWGGEIEFSSIENKGTTIRIKLLVERPQSVLLEDEMIIRKGWELMAKKSDQALVTFSNSQKLLNQLDLFNKKTRFYLDEELGEKLRGRDIAKILYKKGFREIYLCSGYEKEYFKNIRFIKGVKSKEFPTC